MPKISNPVVNHHANTYDAALISDNNVAYIKQFCEGKLGHRYTINESTIRIFAHRVSNEMRTSTADMTDRIIMYILNGHRVYEIERNKHLNWEESFKNAKSVYNTVGQYSNMDPSAVKLRQRYGNSRAGGTLRFYQSG
jgi:hypothetical protein